MTAQSHESLESFRKLSAGSDRKFGTTVGAILCVLALWPAIRHHVPPRYGLLAIGLILVLLGLLLPRALAPLNRAWFRLGLALARLTNPIVMGVMYFLVVVPFGCYLRWRGHDLLRLKWDAGARSYWIDRSEPDPGSLTRQF